MNSAVQIEFPVGSLVSARGREWVVLPESTTDLLLVRPLGGTSSEATGIYRPLESVTAARFGWPTPDDAGDYRAAHLLRDSLRLGFRATAGPFRAYGHLSVAPRPYQLVPLLMALKQRVARLLIADDVGIGKTIEAALIARELLDRGEIRRFCVLCPPHLAEQWQEELRRWFNLEAVLVLPRTVTALERKLRIDQSLFEANPYTVVSLDFIKTDRRRADFQRVCPELVIVDEAHTCVPAGGEVSGRQQRYDLLRQLAANPARHLLLVTATPHSGNEDAFRALLALLDPELGQLPTDLSGAAARSLREKLASYLVQRRRADVRHYLAASTQFPERVVLTPDPSYALSQPYRRVFEEVLGFARERVRAVTAGPAGVQQRVQWWAVLSLLRALASSPAAALATLKARVASASAATSAAADSIGRARVLDELEEETAGDFDLTHGTQMPDSAEADSAELSVRERLRQLVRAVQALREADDTKLTQAVQVLRSWVADGYHPIVFCRFVETAGYVADALRRQLGTLARVEQVTGQLPPEERRDLVKEFSEHEGPRILVATDCLSEGINLQHGFDAVLHYDLAWNPTRHEQREGRVDRYGQEKPEVRTATLYGRDNQIDGIVLDVLLRKERSIRSRLGISVPVPGRTDEVVEAIFEGLLLRESSRRTDPQQTSFLNELLGGEKQARFEHAWARAADQEEKFRTLFAQHSLRPEEVLPYLHEAEAATGTSADQLTFLAILARRTQGLLIPDQPQRGIWTLDLREAPLALREAAGNNTTGLYQLTLDPALEGGRTQLLTRTHSLLENLAAFVLSTTLDGTQRPGSAARAGCTRTRAVVTRTTLLLVRYRFDLHERDRPPLLLDDCQVLAFEGSPTAPRWLPESQALALLPAEPAGNLLPGVIAERLTEVTNEVGQAALQPHLAVWGQRRAEQVAEAHRRVREAGKLRLGHLRVEPHLPPDVLGVYVLLPVPGGGS